MARLSALEENGFKKGTKEFDYFYDKFLELDKYLWNIVNYNATNNRIFRVRILLEIFEQNNFEFTLGDVYYKDLKELMIYGSKVLNGDTIKKILNKYCWTREVNPISYGYEKKEFKVLIEKIKEISKYAN